MQRFSQNISWDQGKICASDRGNKQREFSICADVVAAEIRQLKKDRKLICHCLKFGTIHGTKGRELSDAQRLELNKRRSEITAKINELEGRTVRIYKDVMPTRQNRVNLCVTSTGSRECWHENNKVKKTGKVIRL